MICFHELETEQAAQEYCQKKRSEGFTAHDPQPGGLKWKPTWVVAWEAPDAADTAAPSH